MPDNYMKNLFLLVLITFSLSTLKAQICTPDTSIKEPGLYPRYLPDAVIGTNYNETIQFKFPTDTTYSGYHIHIDSVRISSVDSMPAGFTYACSNSNCLYAGGSNGCVVITGHPMTGQQGDYVLHVNAFAKVKFIDTFIWAPYSDTLVFKIKINTGIFQNAGNAVTSGFSVNGNYPNPFNSHTQIIFSTANASPVHIKVYDILGNEIISKSFPAKPGENRLNFDRTGLHKGLYLYSIQQEDRIITKRMMIED